MKFSNVNKWIKCLFIMALFAIQSIPMANSDVLFLTGFEKYQTKLNDTGVNWGADLPTGNNSTCVSNISSPQDCHQGRDFTSSDNSDGHAGFSFTKLDANGSALIDQSVFYIDSPWSCVKDNVTGLIWEIKTDDGLLHDKGNTYKWGGITAIGKDHANRIGDYYDDWNALVADSNTDTLCGISGWRVPTVTELSSISNKAASYPSIDTDFFPNTISGSYWTASPFIDGISAWVIRFEFSVNSESSRNSMLNLRLVSSGL